MTPKVPFEDHTLPVDDDDPGDQHPESPTESIARELLTQLAKGRAASATGSWSISDAVPDGDGDTAGRRINDFGDDRTREVNPVKLDSVDIFDEATKQIAPVSIPSADVVSAEGDMVSAEGITQSDAPRHDPNRIVLDPPPAPAAAALGSTDAITRNVATGGKSSKSSGKSGGEGDGNTDHIDAAARVANAAIALEMGDKTSLGLARLHNRAAASDASVEVTSPGLMPAAVTGADAMKEKRGDIAQLLASIGPFLWSLEAAEKWVRDHSQGDPEGESHARSLALLARVLGQLQARIDEAAKQVK